MTRRDATGGQPHGSHKAARPSHVIQTNSRGGKVGGIDRRSATVGSVVHLLLSAHTKRNFVIMRGRTGGQECASSELRIEKR